MRVESHLMGLFSLSVEVRKRPPWRQTFRPEDSPRRPHFIPSSGRRTRGRRAGLAPGSGASTGLSKLQTLRGTLSAEVLGTLVGLHNPTPAPGRDQGNLRKLKERVPVSPPGDSRCLKPPPPPELSVELQTSSAPARWPPPAARRPQTHTFWS